MSTRELSIHDLAIAVAVNDQSVLANCLARSPDVPRGPVNMIQCEGFATAGLAYRDALARADRRIVLFVHQDVYLPLGFSDRLVGVLNRLAAADPDWGVAGVM